MPSYIFSFKGDEPMARIGGRPRASGVDTENGTPFVQALAHGLTILSLFDIEHPEWSLGDISRHTSISKTTAYRMLRTLERTGFVSYSSVSERYSIGPAAIPLAYLSLSHVGFSNLTHPILEKLAAATGETVELAVEGQGEVVVVDHVATSHPFKPNLPLGRVLRNMANSGMKVFVAHQSEEIRERLIAEHLTPLTPHTITDPALLREELRKVAETGLAFDMEEQDLGICAVSAPVFGPYNELKAVVTVVAPAERFRSEKGGLISDQVRSAATELSSCLSQLTSSPTVPISIP